MFDPGSTQSERDFGEDLSIPFGDAEMGVRGELSGCEAGELV